jgi:hypothetical protein
MKNIMFGNMILKKEKIGQLNNLANMKTIRETSQPVIDALLDHMYVKKDL